VAVLHVIESFSLVVVCADGRRPDLDPQQFLDTEAMVEVARRQPKVIELLFWTRSVRRTAR